MTTLRSEDREAGVRLLTLDRPPANATTPALLNDLSGALDAARDDDTVRAVVFTGQGRFFSAGLDLRGGIDFQALSSTGAPSDPFLPLRDCDYRLGLEGDYRIGLNEVAIGASFPKAAFEIVRLRLTHQQASELLLGAALYPAGQAARLGVVDELLPADSIDETVFRRATRLGSFPRDAYAHTKAALAQKLSS